MNLADYGSRPWEEFLADSATSWLAEQALSKTRTTTARRVTRESVQSRRIELTTLLALSVACGTDAVGVSDCREIESARCEAAAECGFRAIDECRLYARDHCLHGLPAEAPSAADVSACASDIAAAGQCAAALGPATAPDACDPPLATDGTAASVCDMITRPERATACAFLRPATEMAGEGS